MQKKEIITEKKALNTIYKVLLGIIAALVLILGASFIHSKYVQYDQILNEYESELKGDYYFTNIEMLQFLRTNDLIEYQKLVREIIEGDSLENVSEITVLDTITNTKELGIYEWFISMNDNDISTYKCVYTHEANGGKIGTFSISKYDASQYVDNVDPESDIKDAAISGDSSEYMEGSIDNIVQMLPNVENMGALSEHISDNAGIELTNKLRVFLVETENNRRAFSVSKSSIEVKNDKISFVLKPDITLDKDNTIRAIYYKSNNTFTFEYMD